MILSIHIPKTAGTSFRAALHGFYGDRLLGDYGDWPEDASPEGELHNEARRQDRLASRRRISRDHDVIHGHFLPTKYAGMFDEETFVTFVRDPYQHAVSTYRWALRTPSNNPRHRKTVDDGMTFRDMLELAGDHQSLYFAGLGADEFAFVGVTEQFERSVALFRSMFKFDRPAKLRRLNVDPEQQGAPYEIGSEVRQAVDRFRARDVELYRRALERFDRLARSNDL